MSAVGLEKAWCGSVVHAACIAVLLLGCVGPELKGCSCPVQLLLALDSCDSPHSEGLQHTPPGHTLPKSLATAPCTKHPVTLLCMVFLEQVVPLLLLSALCGFLSGLSTQAHLPRAPMPCA